MWCLTELIGLACVGPKAESGSEGTFCFSIDMKPCWSQYLSFLPLLGRWRPSSLYSSLCDTAGVCIFLFCSSSPSPLFSSCHLLPLSFHGYLSCTHFFLWRKKNQNVTTLTHPERARPHNPSTRTPRFKKEAWMLQNGKCFDPNKTPSMEKGAILICFAACLYPESMRPQLAQAQPS